jgi:hypothetical protein
MSNSLETTTQDQEGEALAAALLRTAFELQQRNPALYADTLRQLPSVPRENHLTTAANDPWFAPLPQPATPLWEDTARIIGNLRHAVGVDDEP